MNGSRSPAFRALFAIVLSALSAGCGGAATPQPQTPAVDIAPPPPSSSAEQAAPPPKAEAASIAAPTDKAPPGDRPSSLPGTKIRFTGGDGSTQEQAIIILGAKGEREGVDAEYRYLEILYGPQGRTWKMVKQSLLAHNKRHFDAVEIDLGGRTQTFYFDITDYFGKF